MLSEKQDNFIVRLIKSDFSKLQNSIITRIVLFSIAVLLLGGMIRYYFSSYIIHSNLYSVVSIHQEALANEVSKSIHQEIELRKTFLMHMAARIPLELLDEPQALAQWLADRDEFKAIFPDGILILDEKGTVIAGDNAHLFQVQENASKYDFFQEALGRDFVIAGPLLNAAKEPALPMSVPIKDDARSVKAVLVGLTPFFHSGLFDRVLNGHIGQTGDFLLIDAQKEIFVAATKKKLILQPTPPKGVNLLHDKALQGYRGSGVTMNARGEEELSAMASVADTHWFVVSRILTKEAFKMEENILQTILRAHVIGLIIVPLVMFLFLYFILKPLLISAAQADDMSLGKSPLRVLPIKRMDEVGYMTAAFNRLISKLVESQKELKELAHYDYLTKLPNRFLMVDRLQQALFKCKRHNTHLALLFMDLNAFKPINDSLGHNAGDEALIEVARRFSSLIRESDTLARIGGDEFVILLNDLDSDPARAMEEANAVAAKCEDVMKEAFVLQGIKKYLGVSVGVAIGDKESSLDDLMVEADTKMYKNKIQAKDN